MIKVEVIENFTLERFNELKNVQRKNSGKDGSLNIGDTFECTEDMAKYLMKENSYNKAYVKVIEVEPIKKAISKNKKGKK